MLIECDFSYPRLIVDRSWMNCNFLITFQSLFICVAISATKSNKNSLNQIVNSVVSSTTPREDEIFCIVQLGFGDCSCFRSREQTESTLGSPRWQNQSCRKRFRLLHVSCDAVEPKDDVSMKFIPAAQATSRLFTSLWKIFNTCWMNGLSTNHCQLSSTCMAGMELVKKTMHQ